MSSHPPELDPFDLFNLPEIPVAKPISDEQFYQNLYHDIRDSVNDAICPLWGNSDRLHRSIVKWQKNLSILPENLKEQLLARLGRAMGVDSHLPK